MKKEIFLTIGLVMLSLIQIFSQVQKDNFYISGNLSFFQSKTESVTNFIDFNSNQLRESVSSFETSQFSFRPEFGFLVSSNLAIGLGLDYTKSFRTNSFLDAFSNSNTPDVDEHTTNQYSFLPFLRYYTPFNPKAGFTFDLQGRIGFGDITIIRNNDSEVKGDQSIVGFSITPTFYYFVTPRLAIEGNIGGLNYTSTTSEYGDILDINTFVTRPTDQSGLSLTFGSSINVGITFLFGSQSADE
jgi:hypothetical protein